MLLNFFAFQKRETSGGTRLRQNLLPPHDDPRGTFLCHGTHVPITQKPPQALSLETVIIVYNRGTTQIDINVHFQCTTMHPSLITGLVPGSSYSFHFRPPSKVHSELKSLQQSHHLLLSANSFKTYFSSSSVFACDELYSSLPYFICQEDFYFLSHILILSLIHPEENFYFSSVTTSSPSSSNCFVSAGVGASVIRQDASLIFGNAITSRILSCFAISITRRSSP